MEYHKPVLVKEVLYFLEPGPGKRYIDATLGDGGHAEAILREGGEVLGIEQDSKMLDRSRRRLLAYPNVFKGTTGNFSDIGEIASSARWSKVDGILFDLGFSSFQIEDPGYGLSFTHPGPLDMRLDPRLGVTAADLVNSLPESELERLFIEVGQEKRGRSIARAIVRKRIIAPIKTTSELANLVEEVSPSHTQRGIHPATRVFMALRIAVNSELENLKEALVQVPELLKKSGRLVVISFHSGEDRIVKTIIREKEKMGIFKNLTTKPVRPSEEEVEENLRSRSSKLRAAERI